MFMAKTSPKGEKEMVAEFAFRDTPDGIVALARSTRQQSDNARMMI
jgi:hypothetical protein